MGFIFLLKTDTILEVMFKNIYIRNSLVLSFVLILIAFGTAYISLRNADYLLVIHFTGGRGIDFLGTKGDIFNVLFSGLAASLVNVFLIGVFYDRVRFLSYLFSFFNIVFGTLLLIAVGVIISVN